MSNYGNSENPLCYDCFAAREDEQKAIQEAVQQEQEIKTFSAETLVKYFFKDMGNGKYVAVKRQVFYAVGGFVMLIMTFWLLSIIGSALLSFSADNTFLFLKSLFILLMTLIFTVFLAMSFFFLLIGLFKVTSEIDFTTRQIRITRTNFRGKSQSSSFPLDSVRVTAVRMGSATTGSIHLTRQWIVRAAILDINTAFISDNADSEKECAIKMLGLYRFFFPDRNVTTKNIITNDNLLIVLSDEELVKFENGTLDLNPPAEAESPEPLPDPSSKWDFLTEKPKKNGLKSFVKNIATVIKRAWG